MGKIRRKFDVQFKTKVCQSIEAGICTVLDICRELGIGFVPFSPLGRGFLTGRFTDTTDLPEGDVRRTYPRFQPENFQKNVPLVHKIENIAAQKGCTPAQLALAWLLAKGNDIVPIPGSKRRSRVEENARAADVQLTAEDVAILEEAAPPGVAAGERYPPRSMSTVHR